MSVVSKIKGFLSRHKNKFIVGGVLISGSIIFTKYAQKRLKEWQEKETLEFIERNKKLTHFESLGRTGNTTIINLTSKLVTIVYETVNTEEIIEALQKNPENKIEVWNALKIAVFSRASLMIYSLVMLLITLRIQFSVIGGYLYKDQNSISTEVQEKYLSLCQKFLEEGIRKINNVMETEIKKCLENVELTKQLRLSDIEAICWAIQSSLASHDDSPIEKFSNYIFSEELSTSNDIYSNLLRDTADFLESDEVKSITTHCINRGFIQLGDQIAECYGSSTSSSEEKFVNPFENKKPLAKLLPIINGLLSRQSLPQLLLQQLISSEKLQTLCANIYESLL